MSQMPTYDRLMNPVLQALRELGGSGSTDEIYQQVAKNLKLTESVLSVLHDPETSNMTEVQYRLAWSRTYLKKFGLLETPQRGLWSLAKKAETVSEVDTRKFSGSFANSTASNEKPNQQPRTRTSKPSLRSLKKQKHGASLCTPF